MTSSVPPLIAYPVILLAIVVILARLSLPNTSISARRITAALVLCVVCCLLRETGVHEVVTDATGGSIDTPLMQQLSSIALMLVVVPLLLVTISWFPGHQRPGRGVAAVLYSLGSLSGVLMIALGTHARSLNTYIDRTPGWETLGYFTLFGIWSTTLGVVTLAASIGELKRGNLPTRHVLTLMLVLVLGGWIMKESLSISICAVLAASGTGKSFVDFQIQANENNTIYLVLIGSVCGALLPLQRLAERHGVDTWTRAHRRLLPMWGDLTDACPEVRLNRVDDSDPNLTPRHRAHRMSIEMRDAMVILTRYAPCTDHPTIGDATLAAAVAVAGAAARKRAGARPQVGVASTLVAGRDLRGELRSLSRLAKVWPQARAAVGQDMHRYVDSPV
ncbi:hypothetical protein GCM10007304_14320 [Rhodococcoides trifolii]|uniref:DUF6545 domain-containing protein n=1 Tax=Rhodococcoides trifolii TaxID=908250 RepID=A0A917FRA9_9NOCA|nr:DUF6545 domain-containing protein [Rhodococcus trifolii]GGG01476.1 hypothetical protein GCM10007304_14320 [Rhodococcus trifolii]